MLKAKCSQRNKTYFCPFCSNFILGTKKFIIRYTDNEIAILSRTGNNGIQKEFCSMFIQPPQQQGPEGHGGPEGEEVWVLEWYLDKTDVRRHSLKKIASLIYGEHLNNEETQCLIMLTHALSSLRQLVITIHGDAITGEIEDLPEALIENSLDQAEIITIDDDVHF